MRMCMQSCNVVLNACDLFFVERCAMRQCYVDVLSCALAGGGHQRSSSLMRNLRWPGAL